MKKFLLPFSLYFFANHLYAQGDLSQKLLDYNQKNYGEKVYLQFDKPFYKPNDDIWFKAYLRDAQTHKASQKSEILYVELINPKGNVEKKLRLVAQQGMAKGDFHLDEDIAGGIYTIKAYTQWMQNFGEEDFFSKEIQVQKVVLPRLLMKLEFERKAYGAGDQAVAKLNLATIENKPLANYSFDFTAQLNGNAFQTAKGKTNENGKALIQLDLPQKLESNDGLLNVMIAYEGNTESISRSIPITLNHLDLQFFPEGGNLVAGVNSQIAFKALNEFGKAADVSGIVLDKQGKQVAQFESFHQGMGAFDFKPLADEKYTVQITQPEGMEKIYELPEVLEQGYSLSILEARKDVLKVKVYSPIEKAPVLLAQLRGEVYFTQVLAAQKGEQIIEIPLQKFPVGIAQITLFDYKENPQAERLAFVNKHRELEIKIKGNKEKYLPREKVELEITVRDEDGLPIGGNFSLSVVNDKVISFADDKQDNILSYLLMSSDLKGTIEEPNFYFNKEEEKAAQALDYLLMTQGWRRFTWQQVVDHQTPNLPYQAEKALVKGKVLRLDQSPIAGATITVLETKEHTVSQSDGTFEFPNLDLSTPLTLEAVSKDGFRQSIQIYDYAQDYIFGGKLKGLITDKSDHSPLPGVNLYFEGTDIGVISDLDGRFEIAVPANQPLLQISAVGYQSQKIKVKGKTEINIQLEEDLNTLGEVVVVGFGANERRKNKDMKVPMAPNALDDVVFNEPAIKEVVDNEEIEEQIVLALDVEIESDEAVKLPEQEIIIAADEKVIDGLLGIKKEDKKIAQENPINTPLYYRAREFYVPHYLSQEQPKTRSDFRETIYWNPDIHLDKKGKATVVFYNSDEVTKFRATLEGIAQSGLAGRTEYTYFTQLPFAMDTKVPAYLAFEDHIKIPVFLKNNTSRKLEGTLRIQAPEQLNAKGEIPQKVTIEAQSVTTLFLPYEVLAKTGKGFFRISFESEGLSDAFAQMIEVKAKGFPVKASFSNNTLEKSFEVEIKDLVKNSLKAKLTAYPDPLTDLMSGIESILAEPYGCFEQTSSSTYPNILAMLYMEETQSLNPEIRDRAYDLIDRGYKRLIAYETKEKGYEWFGNTPPHEGLTAYGLMEFTQMSKVYNVDTKMLQRTQDWLLSRRDGKGGFAMRTDYLHTWNNTIINAYVTYALSEAGYTTIDKELEASLKEAEASKDIYRLALVANTLYNVKKDKKADEILSYISKEGSKSNWKDLKAQTSVTDSQGKSLQVETASFVLMAMLKSQQKDLKSIQQIVAFLVSARQGGGFGSTQATILALQALTNYARFAKQTQDSGTIQVYVNNQLAGEKAYKKGTKGEILIEGLEKYLTEGNHKITVKFAQTQNALPYSVDLDWSTYTPKSQKECQVDLSTQLSSTHIKTGETVRLSTILQNKSDETLPMTVALVGIPSGLSAQPWQLKELQEKGQVDFYEVKDNYVVFYYTHLDKNARQEIKLDLKAEVAGDYEAPASTAYLYYTNEYKDWAGGERVLIEE